MKRSMPMVFFAWLCYGVFAQSIVQGVVLDSDLETPLKDVLVLLHPTTTNSKTTQLGKFKIAHKQQGAFVLILRLKGYQTQKFAIQLTGTSIDLGTLLLYKEKTNFLAKSSLNLSDSQLANFTNNTQVTGLLQATKDTYLKTVAYDFSPSFFKVKGLGSEHGSVLINGIEFNKIASGKPVWSNWGGLNNITNQQEFNPGISPSSYSFGRIVGSTNITIRPTQTRARTTISFASSNRTYAHRLMLTHASGLLKNNWAYTFSISKRGGSQGYYKGTSYQANSLFIGVEKSTKNHSLLFSALVCPNKRGKSSAHTQEVFGLKGPTYNANWGYQNGKTRNMSSTLIFEPICMLNHYWSLSPKASLQTNLAFQFGKTSKSRLGYHGSRLDGDINNTPTLIRLGGANPMPNYYQYLPSYGLQQNSPTVYNIRQDFITNGQINWKNMYAANQNPFNQGHAMYILYTDSTDDTLFVFNSIFEMELTDQITCNAAIQYKQLQSENYAQVEDLLGATKYLDVDNYETDAMRQQSNILHPYRTVSIGDQFKYHYKVSAQLTDGFLQALYTHNKVEVFMATAVASTNYQRTGRYASGKYPEESLGKSAITSFINFSIKAGLLYKITGRHLLQLHWAKIRKAPALQHAFSNIRIRNALVKNLNSEKITYLTLSYIKRAPIIKAKFSGFFITKKDQTNVRYYYADGIGGNDVEHAAFVQEVLTGIETKHIGLEIGVTAKITPGLSLKLAGNLGQYTYNNHPNLTIHATSNKFHFSSRKSHLKNYKLATGPQKAISLGLEYRAPSYWWIGASINFFDANYVAINPLTRTNNFSDDGDIPFNDYDPVLAKNLLVQEQFKNHTITNLVAGKSWKISQYYIGLFLSVTNLANTAYKTGGFEQGRNANFRELRADKALDQPLFGNKYWFGKGRTYFLNLTFRI